MRLNSLSMIAPHPERKLFSTIGRFGRVAILRTVCKRIDVVLWGGNVSKEDMMINANGITHNPEEPPLHRSQRHPDPSVLKNMQEENDRNPERRIEIVENEPECSEECLHCQERRVNNQVICPKASSGPVKVCHEVDDDVVDKDSSCREREVREHVGDWIRCSPVHTVARLQGRYQYRVACFEGHGRRHTCLFRIPRPIIISPISPCESKTIIKGPMRRRVTRVKPPAPVNGRLR